MARLTHIDSEGRARMVDVSVKPASAREAVAEGRIVMSAETFALARAGTGPKGDIRAVAEVAGVMAAKKTSDLIPMCHPLQLSTIKVSVEPAASEDALVVTATARTTGPTGVEMEALTAVSVALLTLYDMLKGIEKAMRIENIRLLSKSGGKSGDFRAG